MAIRLRNAFQSQMMLSPFRVPMEIVSLHRCAGLLETDVVEPGERGTVDVLDGVVRDEKVLLGTDLRLQSVNSKLHNLRNSSPVEVQIGLPHY